MDPLFNLYSKINKKSGPKTLKVNIREAGPIVFESMFCTAQPIVLFWEDWVHDMIANSFQFLSLLGIMYICMGLTQSFT